MTMRRSLYLMLYFACAAAAESPERSPGDMTVAERAVMMEATQTYNACVFKHALERARSDADIRVVADEALGYCESALEALREVIRAGRFPEQFAQGFARSMRDRTARNLLPELAARQPN
jgi:hypothetical protein